MIAHVAETGEQRGRVVMQMAPSGDCNDIAVKAAFSMARAFNAEVEGLFVEDCSILDVPRFPFAFEVSLAGQISQSFSQSVLESDLRRIGAILERKIRAIARDAGVPVHCKTVRGEPVHALAAACIENGPWNVVALTDRAQSRRFETLERVFEEVQGMTGVVAAGRQAMRVQGPVVALIEDPERISAMSRAAHRIAAVAGEDVVFLSAGADCAHASWIEAQVRLVLADAVRVEQASFTDVPGRLRSLEAGFVIAQYDGIAGRRVSGAAPILETLEGPLLLIR